MRKLDDIDSRMLAYSCVESDIQMAESYRRICSDRRSHDGTLDVEEFLPTFEMRSILLPRKSVKNASLPPVKYSKNELAVPTMRCAEKCHHELIGRCVLMKVGDLPKLAGVSEKVNQDRLKTLANLGLIKDVEIGNADRVAYSNTAIRMVTYRDRLSYENGPKTRSPEILKEGQHAGKFRESVLCNTAHIMNDEDNVNEALGLFSEYAREENREFAFDVSRHLQRKYSQGKGKARQL